MSDDIFDLLKPALNRSLFGRRVKPAGSQAPRLLQPPRQLILRGLLVIRASAGHEVFVVQKGLAEFRPLRREERDRWRRSWPGPGPGHFPDLPRSISPGTFCGGHRRESLQKQASRQQDWRVPLVVALSAYPHGSVHAWVQEETGKGKAGATAAQCWEGCSTFRSVSPASLANLGCSSEV